MRRRPRNNDQNPRRNRSSAERFGARYRDRLTIRSCCFMTRLSATTLLAPPGPKSFAVVVSRCARSSSSSVMVKKGIERLVAEQDCQNRLFRATIINSRHTPNLNAFAERFVRSIKSECLAQIVPLGERHLRNAVAEYTAHYHNERNHQGLGNQLILRPPDDAPAKGNVECRERLGGLLQYYHRRAS